MDLLKFSNIFNKLCKVVLADEKSNVARDLKLQDSEKSTPIIKEEPGEDNFRLPNLKEDKKQEQYIDRIEEIIKKNNLIPIKYLGKGAYNIVFETIYKGKQAVAKVTQSAADVQNILRLYSLKQSLGKYSKHILDVFDVKQDGPWYIVIVEKLNPVNEHVYKALFNYTETNERGEEEEIYSWPTNINTKLIHKLVRKILKNPSYRIPEKFCNKFSKDIAGIYTTYEPWFIKVDKDKDSLKKILDLRDNMLKNIHLQLKNMIDVDTLNNILDSIRSLIWTLVTERFPHGSVNVDSEMVAAELPEAQSMIKLLRILKQKYNIDYTDLHHKNIMERPKTHDLVLSDPGLFGSSAKSHETTKKL